MIILFQSHVNPDGWFLLLPPFTDKEAETQRDEVTSPRKMQQKKQAVELGFRPSVTVSEPVSDTHHTTFPLGSNRSSRVGNGWGKARRPETWVPEQTPNTYSVAEVNHASLWASFSLPE